MTGGLRRRLENPIDAPFLGLIGAGGVCGSRAVVYAFSPVAELPDGLRYVVGSDIPIWIYVGLWAVTCAAMFACAFIPRLRTNRTLLAIGPGMPLMWGTLYAIGAWAGPSGSSFVTAFGSAWTWWFISLLIMFVVITVPAQRRCRTALAQKQEC